MTSLERAGIDLLGLDEDTPNLEDRTRDEIRRLKAGADRRYNGWTNYETWAVALWIDNEQGSHSYWCDAAQESWDDTDEDADDRAHDAAIVLAERLKSEHEEAMPDLKATVWANLLGGAFSEVDWYEIAEHYLDDVNKDEKED